MNPDIPPRILLLVDSLRMGGAERLLIPLATGLRDRGFDPRVGFFFESGGNPCRPSLEAAGIPVVDFHGGALTSPGPVLRVASYVRKEHIELIHSHLRYADLVGRSAAALTGVPSISTLHSVLPDAHSAREKALRLLDRLTIALSASRVIAISEAQREAYVRQIGVPAGAIAVQPNGVSIERFRARSAATSISPGPALSFITVAMHRPEKALGVLVRAAAIAAPDLPGLRLTLVGDGPERPALEALVDRLNLREIVCLPGLRNDIPELLGDADVYVQPSLSEAFPTSVLEAMAAHLPVIATRVGGIANIIRDGENGLLVEPGSAPALANAMLRMNDSALRSRLGNAGRAWVAQNASETAWLDGIQHIYRNSLKRPA